MTKKRSRLSKALIIVALIAVLIGVIAPFIMYFWTEYWNWSKCMEWYVRNEETRECEEEITYTNKENINLDNEESCTEAGWTWYEENQICILPDA